ncbi:MAG: hypothetical protein ACI87W_000691 [Halieaceae bacterium]|jgi:hypothetical protein
MTIWRLSTGPELARGPAFLVALAVGSWQSSCRRGVPGCGHFKSL